MRKKTILFDLDGTLTDSGEGIINCAQLALGHFDLPIPDRKAMEVFIGPPLHEIFVKFGVPKERAMEAVEVYRSRYNTVGKYENIPYPGIHDMLASLKAAGHRLLVATSKPEGLAKDIMAHFALDQYFDMICGASLDTSRSTKEQVIEYLLSTCPKDSTMVMVGDTHYDILGAKAHNIPAIGVSWGYGKVEDMQNAGAAAIAYSIKELEELLNR